MPTQYHMESSLENKLFNANGDMPTQIPFVSSYGRFLENKILKLMETWIHKFTFNKVVG